MTLRLCLMVCTVWCAACTHQPPQPCSGPFEPVNRPTTEVGHG